MTTIAGVLDFDGVLLNSRQLVVDSARTLSAQFGIDPERFLDEITRAQEALRYPVLMRAASRVVGHPQRAYEFCRSMERLIEERAASYLYPDAQQLLGELPALSSIADVYILTSGDPAWQSLKVNASGVSALVACEGDSRVLIASPGRKGPDISGLATQYDHVVFADDRLDWLSHVASYLAEQQGAHGSVQYLWIDRMHPNRDRATSSCTFSFVRHEAVHPSFSEAVHAVARGGLR